MVPDWQGSAAHEIPNHWISPTLDPSFFAFWTVQFHRLSIFSLLDRLVREGNCFICLGLFSTVLISIELSNFHWPFYLFYSLSNFSLNFPTSAQTFQLQPELTNFGPNFPISHRTFQLLVFSNFTYPGHGHRCGQNADHLLKKSLNQVLVWISLESPIKHLNITSNVNLQTLFLILTSSTKSLSLHMTSSSMKVLTEMSISWNEKLNYLSL